VLQWGTYFGGNLDDTGYDITWDGTSVIFSGETDSYSYISSPNAYQSVTGTNGDSFLAKFSPSGQRIWSTYYGGPGVDLDYGVFAANGNIFMIGATQSSSAIATTNAFQPTYVGNQDAFISMFDSNGFRVWGTYFGGSGSEEGWSVYADTSEIAIVGRTESSSGISTIGAAQTIFGGAPLDAFLAVIHENCANFNATATSIPDNGTCNGQLNLVLIGGTSPYNYSWSTGGTTNNISSLCSGWYTVTVTDSNQCQLVDSFFVNSASGIAQNDLSSRVSVFPNPASSEITILISGSILQHSSFYTIEDVLGRTVMSESLTNSESKISVEGLPSGYYTLMIQLGNEKISRPIVVSR